MRSPVVACVLALAAVASVWAQPTRRDPCDPDNGGLTLSPGFCAAIVADHLGAARHMAVSPRGDLYVELQHPLDDSRPGSIVALRDNDGDGRFEEQERFGPGLGGTAIAWRGDYLYVGADTKIVRFRMSSALMPTAAAETIVQFAAQNGHAAKPFAFGRNHELFVHVGSLNNVCQAEDAREQPGLNPCPSLPDHAGVFKYDADRIGQHHAPGHLYATGIRHTTTLAIQPGSGTLFAAQMGRDGLNSLWPKRFTARQNAELPGEELLAVNEKSNFGWPYCYYDPAQQKRLQNPEYGGDGKKEGDCAKYDKPIAVFPAHNAPLDLLFYTGTQFPPLLRGAAFVAFHGSWNRAPLPMDGYNLRYVPFNGNAPAGPSVVFATGFTGKPQVMSPTEAAHRPAGLSQALDGGLYVSDDVGGRIWKITYTGVVGPGRGR